MSKFKPINPDGELNIVTENDQNTNMRSKNIISLNDTEIKVKIILCLYLSND